jgi:rRNA maturation RNase YbeY
LVRNLIINTSGYTLKKSPIHSFVGSIRRHLQIEIEALTVNFISENDLLEINKKYLNHDFYTDIITFNYSGDTKLIDGEIFISYENASENAKKYKVKFLEEIGRLIIHGILHLTGLNDKSKSEKILMRKKENELLNMFKFLLLQ